MAEEVKQGGFDFYLRFAKPLVVNLPDPNDRIIAAGWIQKIRNSKSSTEELRTNYLKLLLFVLQRKRLIGPFRENPNNSKDLEDLPADQQIIDIAKSLLQADEADRRERLRGLIAGGGDDFPPYNIECSADLLEYAAAQDIPRFGVHAYYAISNSPITTWDNVDTSYLPKGVNLEVPVEGGVTNIASAASSPAVMNKSHESMSDSRSKSRSRKGGDKSPGRSPKRSSKSAWPAKSPLGSEAPVEDRSPPTWGSNLIEVTDPPDETAFKRSLANRANRAQLMTRGLEASSSHSMQPTEKPSDQSDDTDEPEWFQTPTENFIQQFNNISIRPGTAKSQDIIDEVNKSLLQSGKELSLSQAQADVDSKYPHRRKDMPRTPPPFSKHKAIRDAGQGIRFSPQQFGVSDEEDFAHGPSFLEDQQYSPKQASNVRADMRRHRYLSSALEEIQGHTSLEEQTSDFLVDDLADEVEQAVRTPKNVQRKLKELLNEIEDMKETTPASGGVPVTTPKRSPSPGRKVASAGFDIEHAFALFAEEFPSVLETEYLDATPKQSPHESLERRESPKRSPLGQTPSSSKTPPQGAKLRPESPYTPEKPGYEELIDRTIEASEVPRPEKMVVMPKSTGKKIKIHTKPAQAFKRTKPLNKIDESPEYKKTPQDRFTELYEKLIAEDIPEDTPMSPSTPTKPYQLPHDLSMSPLSPRTPIDKHFGENVQEVEEVCDYSDELYESPKRISPLKELAVTERRVEEQPDAFEDIEFNFDYNPIDFGATAATQNLYEGNLYAPLSPRTPPPISCAEIKEILGTPQKSPIRPRTPPRPKPSPIPSPQFYEMENIYTPQEFQEAMTAHQYTERHRSRDPDRKLAMSSDLRTYGGRHIPLPRHAPMPMLATIEDKPKLEEIVTRRDRANPPAPPSPLTPGLPWRLPLLTGNVRLDEMSEDVQKKLVEPVPQRELKQWEEFVFDSVVKAEDKDYFVKLFNEYNIVRDDLIDPQMIERRALREPGPPPQAFLKPDSPPPRHKSPSPPRRVDNREMRVVTPPQVVLGPDDIPASWATTKHLLDQAETMMEDRERRERAQVCDPCGTQDDGGLSAADDGLFETGAPIIDHSEFTFESPRRRAARLRPVSPPTPEKPTYEELIANARAAKKRPRPSKMALGTGSTGGVRKYHTRPLRHYEPLAYLDRIDESPHTTPEVDWEHAKRETAPCIPCTSEEVDTTPTLHPPNKNRRGRSRIPETGMKPKKLKFSSKDDVAYDLLPQDGSIAEQDRTHFNTLLATLPDAPPQPFPEDLMGQYREQTFSQATCLIDREIPEKHLQQQQHPLSPQRQNIFLPQSPVTPTVSPVKVQTMFADPLYQEMPINFPEEIEGEIEPIPDPYAFMKKMPTRYEGFEDDLIPENVGTTHSGFTCSPVHSPAAPCMPGSPQRPVSPTSPYGLDTFFQTPPKTAVFDRYPDDNQRDLWMEYKPVDYFEADQYQMSTPPKPKSPPRQKTPPQIPRPPSPQPKSPIPQFITPERYPTSPSPFKRSPYCNTPPPRTYAYGLTPTRPSPYKESQTPPGTPPAFAAAFGTPSPTQFTESEPYMYLASPEYINENIDEGQFDFDTSLSSTPSSPDQQGSPTHLTATPPPKLQTPQRSPEFSPLPSPKPISENVDNWDQEMFKNNVYQGDMQDLDKTAEDIYQSPVCSPICSPRSPPTPPQPWAHDEQFASPTAEEFQQMIQSHEFTERHVSRDPKRKLATKVMRTTTGNREFYLPRHAPKPKLPTIYDFDETPERMDIVDPQMPEIPDDVMWHSPEPHEVVPEMVPATYETCGYQASPEREFLGDYINALPDQKRVNRNLFNEFDDSEMTDDGVQNFTPPRLPDDACFRSPEPPETPPKAFSPGMQQRMQRSLYDGSAPYVNYPEILTPPSGSRRRAKTYTPPGPPGRSPVKPSREEMMQNIAECYATPTPYTMGVHTRTGNIRQVPTRPAQDYYDKRMDRIEEVGEQYLTPPSGLRHPRRTYTPQATPRASPRLSPSEIKPVSYTPSPVPSPYLWFKPTYTPPPHLRWSPPPFTPSPTGSVSPQQQFFTPGKLPVKRRLFDESPEHSAKPRSPCTPVHDCRTPARPQAAQQESPEDVFATPEGSPTSTYTYEKEIVYNVANAFAGEDEQHILDTSDIPIACDDEDDMDFQWMG